MNPVVVRNGPRRRRRNRAARRRSVAARPAVVVLPAGQTAVRPGRSRRRRNRRIRRNRGGQGKRGFVAQFSFMLDSFKGNASGVLKFGPSLSQDPAFATGILAAFHQYKISSLFIQYISESSSQTAGSILYELDTTCTATGVTSPLRRFAISDKSKPSATFAAGPINGEKWIPSSQNQFYLSYKGNGESTEIAGCLLVKFTVQCLDPK